MFDAKVSLIVCSPLPAAILLCYFFLLTSPGNEFISFKVLTNLISARTPVRTDEEDLEGGGEGSSEEQGKQKLPYRTMVYLLGKLMPYMVPLFLVYFGEYLINQGIASVLTFPDSFVSGKEYMYYQFW